MSQYCAFKIILFLSFMHNLNKPFTFNIALKKDKLIFICLMYYGYLRQKIEQDYI